VISNYKLSNVIIIFFNAKRLQQIAATNDNIKQEANIKGGGLGQTLKMKQTYS